MQVRNWLTHQLAGMALLALLISLFKFSVLNWDGITRSEYLGIRYLEISWEMAIIRTIQLLGHKTFGERQWKIRSD